jgi:hypothetical protein
LVSYCNRSYDWELYFDNYLPGCPPKDKPHYKLQKELKASKSFIREKRHLFWTNILPKWIPAILNYKFNFAMDELKNYFDPNYIAKKYQFGSDKNFKYKSSTGKFKKLSINYYRVYLKAHDNDKYLFYKKKKITDIRMRKLNELIMAQISPELLFKPSFYKLRLNQLLSYHITPDHSLYGYFDYFANAGYMKGYPRFVGWKTFKEGGLITRLESQKYFDVWNRLFPNKQHMNRGFINFKRTDHKLISLVNIFYSFPFLHPLEIPMSFTFKTFKKHKIDNWFLIKNIFRVEQFLTFNFGRRHTIRLREHLEFPITLLQKYQQTIATVYFAKKKAKNEVLEKLGIFGIYEILTTKDYNVDDILNRYKTSKTKEESLKGILVFSKDKATSEITIKRLMRLRIKRLKRLKKFYDDVSKPLHAQHLLARKYRGFGETLRREKRWKKRTT